MVWSVVLPLGMIYYYTTFESDKWMYTSQYFDLLNTCIMYDLFIFNFGIAHDNILVFKIAFRNTPSGPNVYHVFFYSNSH